MVDNTNSRGIDGWERGAGFAEYLLLMSLVTIVSIIVLGELGAGIAELIQAAVEMFT